MVLGAFEPPPIRSGGTLLGLASAEEVIGRDSPLPFDDTAVFGRPNHGEVPQACVAALAAAGGRFLRLLGSVEEDEVFRGSLPGRSVLNIPGLFLSGLGVLEGFLGFDLGSGCLTESGLFRPSPSRLLLLELFRGGRLGL